MAAEVKAFSWDIHQFNGVHLSEENVRNLLKYDPAKDALKNLTEFALGTEKAKKIAAKLPEKQFLHFSIAYDKKEGLKLIFQETSGCQKKIRQEIVAKYDDEKLEELSKIIEILEQYINAIKTLEKPFEKKSVKQENALNIAAIASPSNTESKTTEETQKIFQTLIKENKEFVNRESRHQKIVGTIEVLFVAADIVGVVRNVIDMASKNLSIVLNCMLGLGGILLVLSGTSSMLSSSMKVAKAVAIKSLESIVLSVVDFLSASGISVVGAALVAKVVATFEEMASVASNAFSVVPYAMIVANCLILASVIYQIVMVYRFNRELKSKLNKEGDEAKNLIEALHWLQTTLKPSKTEETNTEERAKSIIAKKWSEFQVRTGEKAYAFIEKLLSKDSNIHIDSLLQGLHSDNKETKENAIIMAKDILESLKEESLKNGLFLVLRGVASAVLIAVGFVLLFDGGISASLGSSVAIAIACAISIIIDCTPLRVWLLKNCNSIADWFPSHIEKIKERVKSRIEAKDIGFLARCIDIEEIEENEDLLEKLAYIVEIVDYTIENIKDSKFGPWIMSLLPEGIRSALSAFENSCDGDSNKDIDEELQNTI